MEKNAELMEKDRRKKRERSREKKSKEGNMNTK
jgi:hypothetical protein